MMSKLFSSLSAPAASPRDEMATAPPASSSRHHWLVLCVWLIGSLAVLGTFEYRAALRGLICGG